MATLKEDLQDVINRHSLENHSNTPDFILAEYLLNCLQAYRVAIRDRKDWHGGEDESTEKTQ